jgi:hypothetical protein
MFYMIRAHSGELDDRSVYYNPPINWAEFSALSRMIDLFELLKQLHLSTCVLIISECVG